MEKWRGLARNPWSFTLGLLDPLKQFPIQGEILIFQFVVVPPPTAIHSLHQCTEHCKESQSIEAITRKMHLIQFASGVKVIQT
jgi:hypothetical protein